MFTKPTFGSNTSGFGSFNSGASTSSPFGGFKPAAGTTAFGSAPAFGATATAQPNAGGGVFGASNTSGGLFGASTSAAPAPAFGATGGGFGFGATNTGTGLFGASNTSGTLFGGTQQQNTSGFGAKPAGFGFGSTATTGATGGGLFGASTPSTGLFGQTTNNMSSGGLFGASTSGFGQQQQTGTGHVKYNPVVGQDVMVKSGTSQSINIKHHCITCMKEYETKSLEELRLEDYLAGRKGSTSAPMFGGFQQNQTENKPLFGGSTFGQPATTSAPSVFGGGLGTSGGFGQTNTFAFGGGATNTNTSTSLFGANKPAFGATGATSTGLFGAASTQAPGFGTNTSTFGFGSNAPNTSTSLFGAKPATSGFGTGGFGATNTGFGTTGLFGKPQQTAAPTLLNNTPAFGTTAGGFGANTSTGSSLFGGSAFKPAAQPSFGFGAAQPATGLGGGLNSSFSKPTGTGFPFMNNTSGSSLFGNTQTAPTLNFNTGNTTLGGGLGFGNTSALGGSSLGGLGAFGNTTNTGLGNSLGASAGGNVHEQILTLAARPYGDSSLFKDILPDSSTSAEEALRPTNPGAVKALMETHAYRVSDSATPRLHPRPLHQPHHKKSLFDGLEESDASLEDKLSLKPSRKRLVLRPKQSNDTQNQPAEEVRSPQPTTNGSLPQTSQPEPSADAAEQTVSGDELRGINTDLDSSEKQASWLGSRLSWNDSKDKPVDNQPTPRLYPDLDKELPPQSADRRASWLSTKPLRRPPLSDERCDRQGEYLYSKQVTDLSVMELRADGLEKDKENVNRLSVSEEENVLPREAPPHPTGVKLTRPGYYTIPSLDDMINYIRPDGRCVVPHLTIGRKNYGNVFYDCEVDVTGLDLDSLVHFLNKEVIVYPEDVDKPAVGSGLNRRAVVTLDRVWPRDKTEKRPISDPERLLKMDYEGKLRRVCDKHDTKFIEYRPQTGSWVFRVEHFSKYGLTDSDEEDDITPDVLKRQLVTQTLQKQASAVAIPPVAAIGVGLGGLSKPSDALSMSHMENTSLNLLNGTGKGFEMDITEEPAEPPSLYTDSFAFGMKSPTGELAKLENRHSHSVQLMKASLYCEPDMDEEMSVSTGDQLVPRGSSEKTSISRPLSPVSEMGRPVSPPPVKEYLLKPLIVRPHSTVLRYHRKVMPFKKTIAGGVEAACIANLFISRARHSRAGFGPGNKVVFTTAYNTIDGLQNVAPLSELESYVRGRDEDDWSETTVVRMSIGHAKGYDNVLNSLERVIMSLLDASKSEAFDDGVPLLSLPEDPAARRRLLLTLIEHARRDVIDLERSGANKQCIATARYNYEVWQLCDALWGADLDNGGVPALDEQSVVGRFTSLVEWLTAAVADITDRDLETPTQGETEDESDGHSSRIWTLLVGGRLVDACKVAREHGDLHFASILAQACGDSNFRGLIARQLQLWRSVGADSLISYNKRLVLTALAGLSAAGDGLGALHWTRALLVTARYLCQPVPSLDQIISKYESLFFTKRDPDADEDLSTCVKPQTDMKLPLPDYDQDILVDHNGKQRRILDLRYELIRARATNSKPRVQPASYTTDPLDYSLCFGVAAWFGGVTASAAVGAAVQLEAGGKWHLGVAALAHTTDHKARASLIKGVISRNVPAVVEGDDVAKMELLHRLNVPRRWILEAQAHRAKYQNLPSLEAQYLVEAEMYNAAHTVFMERLLPDAVLSDNIESLSNLVEKLNEGAQKDAVAEWQSGGLAVYHYLHVLPEIRELDSDAQSRVSVQSKLEALRPKLMTACRAIALMKTKSIRAACARCELGARVLQLAAGAGVNATTLCGAARDMNLPPDATHNIMYKITAEIADRASESCLDSAVTSPVSTVRVMQS